MVQVDFGSKDTRIQDSESMVEDSLINPHTPVNLIIMDSP